MRQRAAVYLLLGFFSNAALPVATDFVPLQERALGQSLTGASVLNDSLYGNPASSAFSSVYSIDGMFEFPKTFGISILDTKTSGIGGGMGYYRKADSVTGEMSQGARVSLLGKVSNVVGIGVTGKMIWGPTSSEKFYGVDTGVLYNTGFVQAGITLHNAVSENESMNQNRELSIGTRLNWQEAMFFSIAAQSKTSSWNPYQYGFGMEYVSPYFFGLRGGLRLRPQEGNSFWSLGASFISPRLSLHYVCELPNRSRNEMEHILGATILM